MILKRISILLLASGMSASVFAAPAKPEPPKAGEERSDDVICTTETAIGSHIKRRVCATRQAREDKSQADKEALRDFQQGKTGQGKSTPSGGGGFK